jgi:hypothetical protein
MGNPRYNVREDEMLFGKGDRMNKMQAMTLVLIFIQTVVVFSATPQVEFAQGKNKIDVIVGGEFFTSYLYDPKLPKPSWVPVCTPSGIPVTRRYPPTELKGGSMDHEHHVGLFFTVDGVNGTNFWNYYRNPGGSEPKIKHIKVEEMSGGKGEGKLVTRAQWIDKKGKFLLAEKKTMVFTAGENENTLDCSIDLTAQDEKVIFEDIEEGVFALRLSDYLRESKASVSLQPGGPIPKENVTGTGRYFSSNGDVTAKNVWGKRARWVALQGVRKNKVVGIAILNHPASINYPTYWHVRNYGLCSANPLGQGDFQRQQTKKYRKNKVIPLRLTLEPGETVHFRFLLMVYEGVRTTEQIEGRFREFAK